MAPQVGAREGVGEEERRRLQDKDPSLESVALPILGPPLEAEQGVEEYSRRPPQRGVGLPRVGVRD